MKQRKLIATILTIILTAATVLTVFAAFRFEVQFPSKLNTFEYDDASGSFKFDGVDQTFTLGLSDPGSKGEYKAVVQNGTATPLTYAYTISATMSDGNAADTTLLSSIFVYLNGEIMGTLQSLSEAGGLLGEDLYVLPNDTENDTLRLELHLASDATPYENASLKVTVNCTATNHNAQKLTFVDSAEKLIQAISEVNRGAADKTIVLYGGLDTGSYTSNETEVQVTTDQLTVTAPCTFDVQENVTFTNPITVNITSEPVDNIPTDIVTVRSTKGKFTSAVTGFTITAGAIDRKDSAVQIGITIDENGQVNHQSMQYLLGYALRNLSSGGINQGESVDIGNQGYSWYIKQVSLPADSDLSYTNGSLSATSHALLSVTEIVTLTLQDNTTYALPVKIIGTSDAVFETLFDKGGELYHIASLDNSLQPISYSIPLPTRTQSGAIIEWHSSHPSMFSAQGVCSDSANGLVTLTAVIRINESVYTKDIVLNLLTENNTDRLQTMIDKIGIMTLKSTSTGTYKTLNDDYVNLPYVNPDNGYQYVNGEKITEFDITNLSYEIEPAFNFIAFGDPKHAEGGATVVLSRATFDTVAKVKVTAEFSSGFPLEATAEAFIKIIPGDSTDLTDQVLEYVRNQLSTKNVLEIMLASRAYDESNGFFESGSFTMPAEHYGFDITYKFATDDAYSRILQISDYDNATDQTIVSFGEKDENGEIPFNIDPSGFLGNSYDVAVWVEVERTDNGQRISYDEDIMFFTVPAAIHADDEGFSGTKLFKSVQMQVMQQTADTPLVLESLQDTYTFDDEYDYILLHDLQQCTHLALCKSKSSTTTLAQYADPSTYPTGTGTTTGIYYMPIPQDATADCFAGMHYINGLVELYVDGVGDAANSSSATTDPACISNITRYASFNPDLTHITLNNCNLTSIENILKLTELSYLDFAHNDGLWNISGLSELDAAKLSYLNLSGTGVNMEYARPLLTEMYSLYQKSHHQSTPEYYYTHNYTPVANGALLLSPESITTTFSQDGAITTVTGSNLICTNLVDDNGTWKVGEGGGALQIDGKQTLALPPNQTIEFLKPTSGLEVNEYADENGNVICTVSATDAIVRFTVTGQLTSEVNTLVRRPFNETIIVTGVVGVQGAGQNILNINGSGGEVYRLTDDGQGREKIMNVPGGPLPVLSGIISSPNNGEVTIIPLFSNGSFYYPGIEEVDSTNTSFGSYTPNGNTEEVVIDTVTVTGGTLIDDYINIGAEGGTVKFEYSNGSSYTIAIDSSTNIQLAPGVIITDNGGSLTIAKTSGTFSLTSQTAIFSNADVIRGGDATNGYFPVIQANEGCILTIGNQCILLPENAQIELPSGAMAEQNGSMVNVKAATASTSFGDITVYSVWNATASSEGGILSSQRVTLSKLQNATTMYLVYTINNSTLYTPLSNTTIVANFGWLGGNGDHTASDSIVSIEWSGTPTYNNSSTPTTGTSITVGSLNTGDGTDSTISADPEITIPTASLHASEVILLTVGEQESSTISSDSVTYIGTTVEFGSAPEGETAPEWTWNAIRIDGQYITLSNGATYTSSTSNGLTTITVTGGTSTIGQGALLTTETLSVSHDSITDEYLDTPIQMYSVSGTSANVVTVTYSQDGNYIKARVDDILFEPLAMNTNERLGLNYLHMLSEIPDVTHYDTTLTDEQGRVLGSYVQLAPRIYYVVTGENGEMITMSVKVNWTVIEGEGVYVLRNDYENSPRLVTIKAAEGVQTVTVRAQIDVQGVVSYRYFTFTITYLPEVAA